MSLIACEIYEVLKKGFVRLDIETVCYKFWWRRNHSSGGNLRV